MSIDSTDLELNKNSIVGEANEKHELIRSITWKDAFWIVSAVPVAAFVALGGVASMSGRACWLVFLVSVLIGFSQALTYAEIGGLFPNKSGGASVIGAMAWIRYNKFIAPLNIWANWFSWALVIPVIAGLSASYITRLFPADSWVNTWQITLLDLNFLMDGLHLRISFSWFLAFAIILVVFYIQQKGIETLAKVQTVMAVVALISVFVVALVPILSGNIPRANVLPIVPPNGAWDKVGWTFIIAAMAIASYATYCFETSVCYVSEFKDPKRDTKMAIISSAILGVVSFFVLTFAFQGFLGPEGVTAPDIVDGTGVGAAMASMVGGGKVVFAIAYASCILMTVVSLMCAMAGTSRTLYQAAADGWFPKFLSYVNENGVPIKSMITVLVLDMVILLMSNYFFLVMAACVCYLVFHFLSLHSGWIHRCDNGNLERPFKAPGWVIGLNVIIAYLNIFFLGAVPAVMGNGPIIAGIVCMLLIIPLFWYRHYKTDNGAFPDHVYAELGIVKGQPMEKKAGSLPNIALVGGIVVFIISYCIF